MKRIGETELPESTADKAKRVRKIARELMQNPPTADELVKLHKKYPDDDIRAAWRMLQEAGEGRQ
jgi:hypothetical protein